MHVGCAGNLRWSRTVWLVTVGVYSGEGEDSYDVLVAVRLYFMAIAPGLHR
jgi:hypothetical protein